MWTIENLKLTMIVRMMTSFRTPILTIAVLFMLGSNGLIQAEESSPDVRTFTAKNGKTLTARVLDVSAGKVKISRMSDGKVFELPASGLSAGDVDFLKAWLKRRELTQHPVGWKKLRVHLPEFVDEVEAPGIPAAFRRVGLHTWEAELPEDAWVLVRLWRRSGEWHAPEFLLPFDGQADWHFTYQQGKLSRGNGSSRPVLVGIDIGDEGGKEQIKALKEEIPESGVCIFSGFLDDADFDLLGSKHIFSFVVRKTPSLSVAGTKIRAIRVIRDLVSFDGLSSLKELEYLDITMTGDFPLGGVSKLEKLTTLVADGNITFGSAIGDSAWPSLKRLSLERADIEGPEKFSEFLAGVPELESLSLPDENELNVKSLGQCPKLTALRLGDECYDPQVAGLKELKQLRTVFLSQTYNSSEIIAVAEMGLFGKVMTLKTHVEMPFSKMPLLTNLHLTGDQDNMDLSVIAGIPGLENLHIEMMSEDDVQALQGSAAEFKRLASLSVKFPRCPDFSPLANLPALKYLKINDQFGSSEQDVIILDVSRFIALQGLKLVQLQNLEAIKIPGGQSPFKAVNARKCGALTSITAVETAENLAEICVADCEMLTSLKGMVNQESLTTLHLADSPQIKKETGVKIPEKLQRRFLIKAGEFK